MDGAVDSYQCERWLSKAETAEHLGLSVRSVERLIAGGMPHAVILGRVRLHASEVEEWLEATGNLRRRGTDPLAATSAHGGVALRQGPDASPMPQGADGLRAG
jgi:excisionase family DNA binding protein